MKSFCYAALYIRVSTDRQEELSPDAQKRLLIDYAKKNNIIVNSEHRKRYFRKICKQPSGISENDRHGKDEATPV